MTLVFDRRETEKRPQLVNDRRVEDGQSDEENGQIGKEPRPSLVDRWDAAQHEGPNGQGPRGQRDQLCAEHQFAGSRSFFRTNRDQDCPRYECEQESYGAPQESIDEVCLDQEDTSFGEFYWDAFGSRSDESQLSATRVAGSLDTRIATPPALGIT